MANHIHLLIKPDNASQLPKIMHWEGWYASMLLNRLAGRCGHFLEARYYATAIAPEDHQGALNTLRHIHANPKAAGVRKGFDDPYSNYGHYSRLEADGLSDWHPAFPQLAPTLTGRISQCIGQQALPLNLPIRNTCPSSGSKSPSSLAIAMQHAEIINT